VILVTSRNFLRQIAPPPLPPLDLGVDRNVRDRGDPGLPPLDSARAQVSEQNRRDEPGRTSGIFRLP
jgi:hypothetical protein